MELEPWNQLCILPPAYTTNKFSRKQLKKFAYSGGFDHLENWIQELHDTLKQISCELSQPDMVRIFHLETNFLHQIVQQKVDMRSEKFFPKMKQASRASLRWHSFQTASTIDNVSHLLRPPKPGMLLQEHRLPTPSLLHHVLLLLCRGHETLRQVVVYCEEAALWLQCKMSTGQRGGLALALYSIVARLRALSLHLMQCQQSGYDKLLSLLFGVTYCDTEDTVVQGLPPQLDEIKNGPRGERSKGETEYEKMGPLKADIKTLVNEFFISQKKSAVTFHKANPANFSKASIGAATLLSQSDEGNDSSSNFDGVIGGASGFGDYIESVDMGQVIERSDHLSDDLLKRKKKKQKLKNVPQVIPRKDDNQTEVFHLKKKTKKLKLTNSLLPVCNSENIFSEVYLLKKKIKDKRKLENFEDQPLLQYKKIKTLKVKNSPLLVAHDECTLSDDRHLHKKKLKNMLRLQKTPPNVSHTEDATRVSPSRKKRRVETQ